MKPLLLSVCQGLEFGRRLRWVCKHVTTPRKRAGVRVGLMSIIDIVIIVFGFFLVFF